MREELKDRQTILERYDTRLCGRFHHGGMYV